MQKAQSICGFSWRYQWLRISVTDIYGGLLCSSPPGIQLRTDLNGALPLSDITQVCDRDNRRPADDMVHSTDSGATLYRQAYRCNGAV